MNKDTFFHLLNITKYFASNISFYVFLPYTKYFCTFKFPQINFHSQFNNKNIEFQFSNHKIIKQSFIMLQTIINIGIPARLKKKGRIVSSFKSLDRKKVKQDLAASGQLSSATGSIPPTLYTMVPYFVTKMSKERRFKVHNGSWRKFVLRRRNRVSTIVPLFPEKLDRTIVPLKTIVWAEGGEGIVSRKRRESRRRKRPKKWKRARMGEGDWHFHWWLSIELIFTHGLNVSVDSCQN